MEVLILVGDGDTHWSQHCKENKRKRRKLVSEIVGQRNNGRHAKFIIICKEERSEGEQASDSAEWHEEHEIKVQ